MLSAKELLAQITDLHSQLSREGGVLTTTSTQQPLKQNVWKCCNSGRVYVVKEIQLETLIVIEDGQDRLINRYLFEEDIKEGVLVTNGTGK